MTLTSDEQRVREFLKPLREVAPVPRTASSAGTASRFEYIKPVAIFVGAVALVALIALLAAHRRHPAPAHNGRTTSALTYLSDGGIAQGVDGGHPPIRYIVDGPGVQAFAWSPNGRRIAFLQTAGPPSVCSLRLFDTSTGRTQTLSHWVHPSCGSFGSILWSPDGKSIAYAGMSERLYVMNLITRTARPVIQLRGAGVTFGFTWWSGGRLAYPCHWASLPQKVRWCALSPDGERRVLPIRGWDVVWSPTTGRVAYLLDPGTRDHFPYHLQVWVTRTDGSHPQLVARVPMECCVSLVPHLTWSPDGNRLAVTGAAAEIIDIATGRAHRLAWWSPGHLVSLGDTGLYWRP